MSGQKTLNAENEQALYDALRQGDCYTPEDVAARTGWSPRKASAAIGLIRRMAGEGEAKWTIPHLAHGSQRVPYAVVQIDQSEPLTLQAQRAAVRGELQSAQAVRRQMKNGAAFFVILAQAPSTPASLRAGCLEQGQMLMGGAAMVGRFITEVKAGLPEKAATPRGAAAPARVAAS